MLMMTCTTSQPIQIVFISGGMPLDLGMDLGMGLEMGFLEIMVVDVGVVADLDVEGVVSMVAVVVAVDITTTSPICAQPVPEKMLCFVTTVRFVTE